MKILELNEVYKSFPDGDNTIEALKTTTFSINSGELIAIIGPSGSGKSTLLTIMGGLQRPSGGYVKFMGENVENLTPSEQNDLRFNKIGFILQSSNLVPFLNLGEQFELVDRFANRKINVEKADKLMDSMDILKRKKIYPSQLSGGERQRAAICRALYPEPKLILADEPTASLDTEKAMNVVKLLAKETKGENRATVMVTHDNRMLKYCDRVFQIIDGYLTEKDESEFKEN